MYHLNYELNETVLLYDSLGLHKNKLKILSAESVNTDKRSRNLIEFFDFKFEVIGITSFI